MAIACAISYWVITYILAPFVGKASDFLGGMWAVVATVFVFRDNRANSMSAGIARFRNRSRYRIYGESFISIRSERGAII
jgi:hypothetical protein